MLVVIKAISLLHEGAVALRASVNFRKETVETGGRIRDMTEKKLTGEIFSTRGQGTQVGIKTA